MSKESEDAVVMRQHRYKETNKHCVDFGEWGKWEQCNIDKYNEIKDYIKRGYNYEVRELVVNAA